MEDVMRTRVLSTLGWSTGPTTTPGTAATPPAAWTTRCGADPFGIPIATVIAADDTARTVTIWTWDQPLHLDPPRPGLDEADPRRIAALWVVHQLEAPAPPFPPEVVDLVECWAIDVPAADLVAFSQARAHQTGEYPPSVLVDKLRGLRRPVPS